MDYLTFIEDIQKIWTEKDNSKICRDYSLNRSVLPALLKLNKEWKIVFDDVCNEVDNLQLELNHYRSNKNNVDNVEKDKKIIELQKVVIELQNENEEYRKEVRNLKDDNYNLRNSSLFKKLVG